MCYPVTCKTCGKTTWAGCGQHVDSVMSKVPADQRCPRNHPQEAKSASASASVLGRLFNRS